MAHRPGFVIPNASDFGVEFRQAEPDAGDFIVLGSGNYGVLQGCNVAVNSLTISLVGGPNIVVNNGVIQDIGLGSVSVAPGGEVDRLDLVVWDGSSLNVIHGAPSDDAKFPELPEGVVLLWSVLVGSGASSITTSSLVDKRKWFTQGAKGSVGAADVFAQNYLPSSGEVGFTITGDGTLKWATDGVTVSYQTGPKRLVVSGGKLVAEEGFNAGATSYITGDLHVSGTIFSSDRLKGPVDPNGAGIPGNPGDIYSNTTTGQQYTYKAGIGWAEIYADEYPPGTVIASLLLGADASTHMTGWLPLDGSQYLATDPALGRIPSMASLNGWKSNVGGAEVYTLPDTRGAFFMGATGNPGAVSGSNTKTLTTDNLPPHKHFPVTSTSSSGAHSHSISVTSSGSHTHSVSGGAHSHTISDPGHMHGGNHGYNIRTSFILVLWGGKYRLKSGPGTDPGPSVDAFEWSTKDETGITIPVSGSHAHVVSQEPAHSHVATASTISGHSHDLPTETSVGNSTPVDITPKHLSVVYYIKV